MRIEEIGYTPFWLAIRDFWLGFVDFKGRSTRSGYVWGLLGSWFLMSIPLIFFYFGHLSSKQSNILLVSIGLLLALIMSPVLILPTLAIIIRRMRDTGLSKMGIFIVWGFYLIVYLGLVWMGSEYQTKAAGWVTSIEWLLSLTVMGLLALLPSCVFSRFSQAVGVGHLFHNVS